MATLSYINVFAEMPPSRWLDELKFNVVDFDGNTITLDNGDGTQTILYSDASGFTQGSGGSFDGNVVSMELVDPNQGNLLLQQVTGINFKIEDLVINFPDAAYFILGEGSTVNVNSSGIENGSEIWNYQGADIWNIGQDGVTVHADNVDGETFTFSATSVGPVGETVSYKYNADGTLNTNAVRLNLSLNGIQDLDFLREGSASAIGVTNPFADDTFFGVNHAIGSEGNDYIRGAAWIGNTVWLDPNAIPGSNVNLARVGSTLEGGGGDDTLDRAYIGYGGEGDDYITIYAGGEINHEWAPGLEDYPDFGPAGNVFNDLGAIGGGPPVDYFVGGGHAHGGNGNDTFQLLPGTLSTAVATTIHYYLDGDGGSDWIDGAVRFSGVNGFGERNILPFDATDFSTFGIFTLDVNLSTNFANLVLGINTTSSVATQIVYEVHNIENVRGTNKSDRIIGDDHNNIIEGDDGADQLNGNGGLDTLSYEHSDAAVNVDLSTNTVSGGHADGDQIFMFENVMGSEYNDDLTGDDGDNILIGGDGNDLLDGGGDGPNGDTASYFNATAGVSVSLADITQQSTGAGVDTLINIENLTGSDFADDLKGSDGSNTLTGRSGDDTLNGGLGADMLDGGDGIDTASYEDSSSGVTIFTSGQNGRNGDAQGDQLTSIENITGSDHADQIVLNAAAPVDNTVNSGDGDDRIRDSDGGSNTLNGEGGEDFIIGGDGIDMLDGGLDSDIIFGGDDNDIINGGAGDFRDELFGNLGNDTINGEGGDDRLRGQSGEDTINGGTGNDNIRGGVANDMLFGDDGNDTILGDQGDDMIDGGAGNDRLFGGNNSDMFIFATDYDFDRILDFQTNRDDVDLTDFGLADYKTLEGIMMESAGNVVIDFGGGDILQINNITIAQLDSDNFIL